MTNIILTILILILNIAAFGQDKNAIYKKVVEDYTLKLLPPNADYTLKTTLIVLEKPNSMDSLDISDFARFKKKYEKLDKQTFVDFLEKTQERVQFEDIHIPNIEFIVFKSDSVPKNNELIARYPNWIFSVLEFSNIGFNKENNQALIYYSFNSGASVGGGFYMVYEKKRRKWKQFIQ